MTLKIRIPFDFLFASQKGKRTKTDTRESDFTLQHPTSFSLMAFQVSLDTIRHYLCHPPSIHFSSPSHKKSLNLSTIPRKSHTSVFLQQSPKWLAFLYGLLLPWCWYTFFSGRRLIQLSSISHTSSTMPGCPMLSTGFFTTPKRRI